jgi:hypothetical protein
MAGFTELIQNRTLPNGARFDGKSQQRLGVEQVSTSHFPDGMYALQSANTIDSLRQTKLSAVFCHS